MHVARCLYVDVHTGMCECMYVFAQLGTGVYMVVCHCEGRMEKNWLISSLGVRYQTEGEFCDLIGTYMYVHVLDCCQYLQLHLPLVV